MLGLQLLSTSERGQSSRVFSCILNAACTLSTKWRATLKLMLGLSKERRRVSHTAGPGELEVSRGGGNSR